MSRGKNYNRKSNINRDDSWLEFNQRVLHQTLYNETPLLEKIQFLSIFASNLDEFFMKRMGRLYKQIKEKKHSECQIKSSKQQITKNREKIITLLNNQTSILEKNIFPELKKMHIPISQWNDLSAIEKKHMTKWYKSIVHPVLIPLTVDLSHPFPLISNLSMNLGVIGSPSNSQDTFFCRVKIPPSLPQLVPIYPNEHIGSISQKPPVKLLPLVELIEEHLSELLPRVKILETLVFRLTRGLEVDEEDDEVEDLLEFVEESLQHRRFADVVRLEYETNSSAPTVISILKKSLNIDSSMLYRRNRPLDHTALTDLKNLPMPQLIYPKWEPVVPKRLQQQGKDIFTIIQEKDLLVHHPYESFLASTTRFLEEAANDPQVLAIKQTIYRTQLQSSYINNLISAADQGKQVSCLVEVRARFDENRNLQLIKKLEDHGIHVSYGSIGLKTHNKCSLVVRSEKNTVKYYAHISTGNYHPESSKIYSDIGLFTCHPAITSEIVRLFNSLTGHSKNNGYQELLVAPGEMRSKFFDLIDTEIRHAQSGKPAKIIAKMNQLEDSKIIKKLQEASSAGVQIKLLIRGFCCLRPGIRGETENISVKSAIGRFLEHSRIYYFSNGHDDLSLGKWYIGSADWMERNFDRRVEVVVPIFDNDAKEKLHRIIDVNLNDRKNSWELQPTGNYINTPTKKENQTLGVFDILCEDALKDSR